MSACPGSAPGSRAKRLGTIDSVNRTIAADSSEVEVEPILAGQAAARAAGKGWGGSTKGRRVTVTAERVATIRRPRAEGVKVAAIARAVGLSRPTVYAVLRAAAG